MNSEFVGLGKDSVYLIRVLHEVDTEMGTSWEPSTARIDFGGEASTVNVVSNEEVVK
jgi:hypothetical protein